MFAEIEISLRLCQTTRRGSQDPENHMSKRSFTKLSATRLGAATPKHLVYRVPRQACWQKDGRPDNQNQVGGVHSREELLAVTSLGLGRFKNPAATLITCKKSSMLSGGLSVNGPCSGGQIGHPGLKLSLAMANGKTR